MLPKQQEAAMPVLIVDKKDIMLKIVHRSAGTKQI